MQNGMRVSSSARSVAVIGAGAAGVMSAIHAAGAGADAAVVERTDDGCRKILISGGGRCNLLPLLLDENKFFTNSSRNTLKKIVRSWPLPAVRKFFECEAGILLADELETEKVFPASGRAAVVRNKLMSLAKARGVRMIMNACVTRILPEGGKWIIEENGKIILEADALVIATGGLAAPKTGSDGSGLALLEELGYEIVPTFPALTPLLSDSPIYSGLAGISLNAAITAICGKKRTFAVGGFLFTHRGYSGPAVLEISHEAVKAIQNSEKNFRLLADWNSISEEEWRESVEFGRKSNLTVAGLISRKIPSRLAERLMKIACVNPSRLLAHLTRAERERLIDCLVRCELPVSGYLGYDSAEVTAGGVALSEINPKTMESRRHRGLYFCGELLDAFGAVGGYNFFWAWATGRLAGMSAAKK